MDRLESVMIHLKNWQRREDQSRRSRKARCLEAIRWALNVESLWLPSGQVNGRAMWAIECFERLAEKPERYGWKRASGLLPEYCLVFFKKTGWLPWRNAYAGHVAVLDVSGKKHYANITKPMSRFWSRNIVGAFVPRD